MIPEKSNRKFKVVRSSAGSGKTYTLVKHYLLMMLRESDIRYYRHILAITFTNKATNEMKERVIEALNGISSRSPKYEELTADLSKELVVDQDDVIRKSDTILRNLIHDYSEFAISTIDRFVYKVIRSFSFELNLSAGSEIEMNRDSIIENSVDALLDKLSLKNSLTDLLVDFADFKFSTEKSLNVNVDLVDMASEVINDKTEAYLEELDKLRTTNFQEVRKKLKAKKKDIESELRKKGKALLTKIDDLGLTDEEIAGGKSGLPSYFKKYITGRHFEMKEPYKKVFSIQESGNWKSSKVKNERALYVDGNSTELNALLEDYLTAFEDNRNSYEFCSIMLSRIHSMAVVNEIHKEIKAYKQENELVQLDDFNTMISQLIDDSPVPYIYERIGEKYHHYLIDEFQDTSQIQWYNLIPLIDNSLSEGHDSVIVGDVKQAIYRFRGGDAEQMSRLPELHFPGKENIDMSLQQNSFKSAHEIDVLVSNYRSSKSVVEFVNDFFGQIKTLYPDETETIYDKHAQEIIKEIEGSVELRFLPSRVEDEVRLNEVYAGIEKFIEAKYEYGDITILCRKRSQCTAVADFLIQKGIPVLSSESLKLASSNEVQFLIHWIRYLKEKDNSANSFPILQYLANGARLGGLSNDDMLKRWKEGKDLVEIISEAYPRFDFLSLPNSSLLELCTTLSRVFLEGRTTDPFIVNFIDHVSKFQTQWGNDIAFFLDWWEEKGVDIDVEMPESDSSVKIMTVHKAKGLEFKIVIVPYMHGPIKSGENHFWLHTKDEDAEIIPIAWLPAKSQLESTNYKEEYHEEMQKSFIDTLNLMYVAMTRAAEHLLILSINTKDKYNKFNEENLLWKCFSLSNFKGSEENAVFYRGALLSKITKEESRANAILNYTDADGYNWKNRVKLAYRIDKNVLSDKDYSAQEYGNLAHDILSKIDVLSDLPEVLRNYELRGVLSKTSADQMLSNIKDTIEKSVVEKYFVSGDYDIHNERDLLSAEGQILRPDRLCFYENEVVVMDYKTGVPDFSHEEQIRTYMRVLKDMGMNNIKSYLIYLANGSVKEVA